MKVYDLYLWQHIKQGVRIEDWDLFILVIRKVNRLCEEEK